MVFFIKAPFLKKKKTIDYLYSFESTSLYENKISSSYQQIQYKLENKMLLKLITKINFFFFLFWFDSIVSFILMN